MLRDRREEPEETAKSRGEHAPAEIFARCRDVEANLTVTNRVGGIEMVLWRLDAERRSFHCASGLVSALLGNGSCRLCRVCYKKSKPTMVTRLTVYRGALTSQYQKSPDHPRNTRLLQGQATSHKVS